MIAHHHYEGKCLYTYRHRQPVLIMALSNYVFNLAYTALWLLIGASAAVSSQRVCTVESFEAILADIDQATSVNYAESVPQGGFFGDADTNLAIPINATDLPQLCAVSIHIVSSPNSSFNFAVFLPQSWNGRILTTGNGGLGGGINFVDMGRFSHYGFATISTDTGHSSNPVDGSWAFNQPEKIIDWGWRAMHGSVTTAKQIVNAYYGRSLEYSYYVSCSTGRDTLQLLPSAHRLAAELH